VDDIRDRFCRARSLEAPRPPRTVHEVGSRLERAGHGALEHALLLRGERSLRLSDPVGAQVRVVRQLLVAWIRVQPVELGLRERAPMGAGGDLTVDALDSLVDALRLGLSRGRGALLREALGCRRTLLLPRRGLLALLLGRRWH